MHDPITMSNPHVRLLPKRVIFFETNKHPLKTHLIVLIILPEKKSARFGPHFGSVWSFVA